MINKVTSSTPVASITTAKVKTPDMNPLKKAIADLEPAFDALGDSVAYDMHVGKMAIDEEADWDYYTDNISDWEEISNTEVDVEDGKNALNTFLSALSSIEAEYKDAGSSKKVDFKSVADEVKRLFNTNGAYLSLMKGASSHSPQSTTEYLVLIAHDETCVRYVTIQADRED